MNEIVFFRRNGEADAAPIGGAEGFAEYVEDQAERMERCGYMDEAANLRRWLKELRTGGVEAGYRLREPLLPRN